MSYVITDPPEYTPFDEVLFCGNTIRGPSVPFRFDGTAIVLIGAGAARPRVWLRTLGPHGQRLEVVRDNQSALSKISIKEPGLRTTKVISGGDVIVHAQVNHGLTLCTVDTLDLRPLGFRIWGDATALNVGGGKFSGNVFSGVATLFSVR